MNEENNKNGISPLSAFILAIGGVIVTAIIVSGVLAYKVIDKIENQQELLDFFCNNLKDIKDNAPCRINK